MSATPRTWADITDRLAAVFGSGGEAQATAEEWIREACEVTWGADLYAISRAQRQIALQRCAGTVLALADEGEIAFQPDVREIVARTFARYWKGAVLHGPPWRLSPTEEDRPLYATYAATHSSSFD